MHVNTLSSLAQLLASAETETLAFPTSINTALLLQKELANPDCHSADISRLLLCEPTLSARAVALAKSCARLLSVLTCMDRGTRSSNIP